MNVDDDWARFKELVKIKSPSPGQGKEMIDIVFGLLRTPQGRARIDSGLREQIDGKTRAIRRIVRVLEERRLEAEIPLKELIGLLEHLSDSSFRLGDKPSLSDNSWISSEAGDPGTGRAVLEVMERLQESKGKSASAVRLLTQLDSWKPIPERQRRDLLEAALGCNAP